MCDSAFVFDHVKSPRSTHTATIPVPAGSVHAHTQDILSRAGAFTVGRTTVGAVTCVARWLDHGLKKQNCKNVKRFLYLGVLPNETQLHEYSLTDCACPQQRSGLSILLLLMKGRKSRRSSAVDVVQQYLIVALWHLS